MEILIIILLTVMILLLSAVIAMLFSIKGSKNRDIPRDAQTDVHAIQDAKISEINAELHRMNDSVSKRLEQMSRSVGEMYSLTSDVNDLKKILSNVKTRGILGELQLKSILEEILTPSQYEENCYPVPGSRAVVEFALKLPGAGEDPVYLPMDSKFPATVYHRLRDAYDGGDSDEIDEAAKALVQRLAAEAADINKKYICPPYTTDFAIMFLPFEGLYLEAVNRGMTELLQRKYNVMIAGPSTMAAMLNALQVGFRTLAVERRSSEVQKTLLSLRTDFEKFGSVLDGAIRHTEMLENDLRKLSGVRTDVIMKKLNSLDSDG